LSAKKLASSTTAAPPVNQAERLARTEQILLGGIVLNNSFLRVALNHVLPENFFDLRHGRIFLAMLELAAKVKPINIISLVGELRRAGELGSIGESYVSGLIDGLQPKLDVNFYAREVKEHFVQRSIAYVAQEIQQQAEVGEDSASLLANSIEKLKRLSESAPENSQEIFDSFEDFESVPGLEFAIENFLQCDGANFIAGLSGHGKTLISASITKALLVGEGTSLWNLFRVQERAEKIIYLIPESARGPFKHRLKLFGLYDFVKDGRLLIRTLSKGPTPSLSDVRILAAAKRTPVVLDTAIRFGTGVENDASDNMKGLAADIFRLLECGARLVLGLHHAPKNFATADTMTLENIMRGSGDLGAMLATCWGVKQISGEQNIIHIENVKARDFSPCAPFQLIGRPSIDETGDFKLHKAPGVCGYLCDEQVAGRNRGGAPPEKREERARRVAMVKSLLAADRNITNTEILVRLNKQPGINVGPEAVKKYITDAGGRV
jgi:DnaB-like helicase N terminal domain/AAA domain